MRRVIHTLALATFTISVLSAQRASDLADVTFQANTQEVLVDAVVTDKHGNVPRDLTAQDFKILEDGKEQRITSLSFTGDGAPGHTGKHFVALVFDYDEPDFREEATRFVDQFSSPDLYIAIYARVEEDVHLVQAFTTDPVRLRAALRDMRVVGETRSMRWVRTVSYGNHQIPDVPMLDRIDKVTAELKPIHGRKALVLFANGLISFRAASVRGESPVDRQFLQTIDHSNQANVAIYGLMIDASIESASGWYSDDRSATTTNRLRDLADRTGGKYGTPGSNQLAAYLGSIATEQDAYYLLGYTPSGKSGSSNCHKLQVTVLRKDLHIDARDTYCATGGQDRSLRSTQRALEARGQTGEAGAVVVSVQAAWFYLKRGAIVDAAMNIGPAATQLKDKLHGEIPILGVAYRADGSVAARFGDTIDLHFQTQSELDEFLKSPYRYSNQVMLPPGAYRIRVIAGAADKAFGAAEQTLTVPPWGGDTFSASAIALCDHETPLTGVTALLDSTLLDGPYRLASRGRECVPMGSTQFHVGQPVALYFEIYEPPLAVSTSAHPIKPPRIDLTIVDRAKDDQIIDSHRMETSQWTRPGSALIPIAMPFPSANLPTGLYRLEVRMTHDQGADEVVRTTDFEVR